MVKVFDSKYNDIPKSELHVHLEGAIRTQTVLDVAKEYSLPLPADNFAELDQIIQIREQQADLDAVLRAFDIFQKTIASDSVVERIAWEFFEDSAKQNVKLLECRFSPDWAFSGHNVDWDKSLASILLAKAKAERGNGSRSTTRI